MHIRNELHLNTRQRRRRMFKEIGDITQSEFAKFKAQYLSGLASGKVEDNITFRLLAGSNNVMELQYYILLLDSLMRVNQGNERFKYKTSIVSNAAGNKKVMEKQWGEDWGRINTYLSCFSDTFFKDRDIFAAETFGKLLLKSPEYVDFGRIIPLIPIDLNTFEFLSQRVEDAFAPSISTAGGKHFNCTNSINVKNTKSTGKDGKEHEKLETTFKVIIRGLNSYKKAARNVLYTACMKYLFSFEKRSTLDDYYNMFIQRIAHYASPEFFDKVKDISVLSLLIFCAYNRFNLLDKLDYIKESDAYKHMQKKYTQKILAENFVYPDDADDEFALINAQDMADGLLQLIENAVFHAGNPGQQDGFGVLSLRVYKEGQQSKEIYLNQKYKHYFDGHDNRHRVVRLSDDADEIELSSYQQNLLNTHKDAAQLTRVELEACSINREEIDIRKRERASSAYYLEVRLADNSGKNMCAVFLDNHKTEGETFPFLSTKEYHVKVSTFFDPDVDEQMKWKAFNSNSNNVIHHYGLQLFDAILQSLDGCFLVQSIAVKDQPDENNFYSSSGDQLFDNEKQYFSGTQYSILLPFIIKREKPFSFINTNVEFPLPSGSFIVNGRIDKEVIREFSELLVKFKNLPYNSQEDKKQCVLRLSGILEKYQPGENIITVFNANDLSAQNIELFAKALIQFIAKSSTLEVNIAITNCNDDTFKKLVRIFTIFYDRTGSNELMKNTQIHLSGKNQKAGAKYRDEFLLAGANLHDTLTAQIKLDAARGLTRESSSGIISFLTDMLKRRPGRGNDGSRVKYIPFDLLIKEAGISIFEQNVINTLLSDVQQKNPGCMISPNHMRIGSKIHVDKFYEAMVLFGNNYYTGRFAWLLKEQITKIKRALCTQERPYLFVGYESYSEILLRDICKLFPNSEYCVFEYGVQDPSGKVSLDRFRRINMLTSEKIYQLIYIVPINSTLSTFNKLEASFMNEVKKRNKTNDEIIKVAPTAEYFGVIQTRHGHLDKAEDYEEKFFTAVDTANKSITSKLLSDKNVYYLFCVQATWSNPLQCEQCYPSDGNYIFEKPLIETDKTSVIPAQLFGVKEVKMNCSHDNESTKLNGGINELYGHVIFEHTYRNSNHFQYYVKTDELFEEANKSNGDTSRIHKWLEGVRKKIVYDNEIHYDIIICPEHYSNSGFVKYVNDVVFGGASLVISVNVGKEFRDNFKAKHSDIANIVENLSRQHVKGEINFHYVDDTIINGANFSRVKSLVNSLCSNKAKNVAVNIFKSVIVLLDRNSGDSIQNYCNNPMDFHAYLKLFISSLRTHNNACVLCQETAEYERLSKRASLNTTYKHFWEKFDLLKKYEVMSCANSKDSEYTNSKYKEFVLMACMHYFNKTIRETPEKNYRSATLHILLKILITSLKKADENHNANLIETIPTPDSLTLIMSYITVASSPFQSFRKATHEAVFKLILLLLEVLLDSTLMKEEQRKKYIEFFLDNLADEFEIDEKEIIHHKRNELQDNLMELTNIVIELIEHKDEAKAKANKLILLRFLMNQSVSLKSNYIIRRDNIMRILWVSIIDELIVSDEADTSFINDYLFQIKRLIASSSDEAKAMFVEYMLLSGQEYPKDTKGKDAMQTSYHSFGILNNELTQGIISRYFEPEVKPEQFIKFNALLKKLVYNVYLENTQIIYDAVCDLDRHPQEKEVNELYFLENYKTLLCWNDNHDLTARGEKTDKKEILKCGEHIVSLYEQLKRNSKQNSWSEGEEYYEIFLKRAKQVLGVEKVYLFMDTGTLIQLFPDDCYAEPEMIEYVRSIAADSHIGDTYYFNDKNNIRTIKFNPYKIRENSENIKTFVWYLAFEVKENCTGLNLAELTKVRNLLAMRSTILEHLEEDFENNHSPDYVQLKDKVLKLSNEKIGSHTPFKELNDFFDSILNELLAEHKDCANQLKLISDSIISKI